MKRQGQARSRLMVGCALVTAAMAWACSTPAQAQYAFHSLWPYDGNYTSTYGYPNDPSRRAFGASPSEICAARASEMREMSPVKPGLDFCSQQTREQGQFYDSIKGCYIRYRHTPTTQCGYNDPPPPPYEADYPFFNPESAPVVDRYHDTLQSCAPGNVELSNPIQPMTGAKRQSERLGHWLGQSVTLLYDTRPRLPRADERVSFGHERPASFGPLWTTSLHRRLSLQLANSLPVGIQAARPDGSWISFTRNDAGAYVADADVDDRLIEVSGGWRYVDARHGAIETYDSQGVLRSVAYAKGGSLTFGYSDAGTPPGVAPRAGLLIRVEDAVGRAIRFEYEDPDSRVARIIDPAGRTIQAIYQGGNLSELVWQDGHRRKFLYEDTRPRLGGALTGIVDERDIRISTYDYADDGRATGTRKAGGVDAYSVSYGQPPSWSVSQSYDTQRNIIWRDHSWQLAEALRATDPRGQQVDYGTAYVHGLPKIVSISQPAGAGCGPAVRTMDFDTRGNLTVSDDFRGHRACVAYEPVRNLATVRVEGLPAATACAGVLAAGAALPAGSRKTSTQWHPDWPVPVRRAVPGALTTEVYNGQPDPFNGNSVASCTPAGAMTPDGKPLVVPCKRVVQSTIDGDGRRGFDMSGGSATAGDPHHGNVGLLLHFDGTSTADGFVDASSRALAPASIVAPVAIDPANAKWGASSGHFAGGYLWYSASPEFDMGAGNFTVELWVRFNAESAGSRVILFGQANASGANGTFAVAKGANNLMSMSLVTSDGTFGFTGSSGVSSNVWYHLALVRSGNTLTLYRNGVVDVAGSVSGTVPARTTKFGVGVVGEYTATYGGAYGARMMGWIDDFRITKGVARYTAPFSVPTAAFGNSVGGSPGAPAGIDAGVPSRVWSYTYDAQGRLLSEDGPRTDASDVTTYTYYADSTADYTIGDLKSVKNAAGRITSFPLYDRHGQVLRSIDPNNVATDFTYDERQRLKTVTVGGQVTAYDYHPNGLLKRVTEPGASVIEYAYDDAQRLVAVSDQRGNRIDYTLEVDGQRKGEKVQDPGGALRRQMSRVMDALGRVQQITTGRE